MLHENQSPLAGGKAILNERVKPAYTLSDTEIALDGAEVSITDWFDRVFKTSWQHSDSALAVQYHRRALQNHLPMDDDVLVGRVYLDEFGWYQDVVVHLTEIDKVYQ